MRANTIKYIIKEGFKSLSRNKGYTIVSIATISACLFLVGIFCSVVLNLQNIVRNVQKGVSITVFFDEGVEEKTIQELQQIMADKEGVEDVTYTSAEQAWQEFVKDMKLEEYIEGYPDNPLANSANISIFLNDVEKQPELVAFLEAREEVRRVNKSELAATTLSGVDSFANLMSMGIIGILLIVSVFLITNTIANGILKRQDEINIMKYIGATDVFVRSPFIISGILIGLIGALIPLGIIYIIYQEVIDSITKQFVSLSNLLTFLTVDEVYKIYFPIAIIIGVGIGFIGSYVTCHKYLKV